MKTARIAGAWLGAVMLTACTQKRIERPGPPPSIDVLLAALRARQAAVASMNARVRATSWLGGERVRATVNMLVDRPGRLRFEAEVSLQGTVAVLATDGRDFSFLDVQKNTLSRGPACPANVGSLIRIPLGAAEVAALLLGDAALPVDAKPTGLSWDPALGADVLAFGAGLAVSLRQRGASFDVVAVEGPSDKGRWKVLYQDLESAGGELRMPALVRFAEDGKSFDDGVEIKVKDRRLGEAVPADRFRLETPPGVVVVDVGCGTL